MANVFDEQFKRRVASHVLVCDPVSADIIMELRQYVELATATIASMRSENNALRGELMIVRRIVGG